MAKKILHGREAQEALVRGINIINDAVKTTIGPRGRNVAYDKGYGVPTITNDGVSIVKEIILADKFENMGAEIAKEVATKTNDIAGDGTTTSIVLTSAISTEGIKRTSSGENGLIIRRGIESATNDAVEILKEIARPVKNKSEIKQVATISAESEEMGSIIADTIEKVGQDGVVTVEESQSFGVTSEVVDGFSFDKGFLSHYMVTNSERMEAVYENVPVLVTDKKISAIKEILPLLEKMASTGKKDLVIIADEVEGEALTTIVLNKIRGVFNILAIKAPNFGDRKKEELEDIATVLGATLVTNDLGIALETADTTVLGRADKIIATKDNTIIVGGKGKKTNIKERIEFLKSQHKNSNGKFDNFTREHLEKRIARLSNGVAVIRVGAATETEMKYLKLKLEDAVNATKAAIEEGIVVGGGVALAKVSKKLRLILKKDKRFNKKELNKTEEEFLAGYKILINALCAPLIQITKNAGTVDPMVLVEKVINSEEYLGVNINNIDSFDDIELIDMFQEGIIDPLKVTKTALINASSAAAILLTTDVAMVDIKENDNQDGGSIDY